MQYLNQWNQCSIASNYHHCTNGVTAMLIKCDGKIKMTLPNKSSLYHTIQGFSIFPVSESESQ